MEGCGPKTKRQSESLFTPGQKRTKLATSQLCFRLSPTTSYSWLRAATRSVANFSKQRPLTSGVQVEGINEIAEMQVLRGWAFVRNKVDVTATTAGGETVHLSGCTLALFRQEADGRWRLARHANMLTTKKLEQGRLGGVV
jgi:hypothetical protein